MRGRVLNSINNRGRERVEINFVANFTRLFLPRLANARVGQGFLGGIRHTNNSFHARWIKS